MSKTRWLRIVVLIGVIVTGYGGMCDFLKKDKSGSSTPIIVITNAATGITSNSATLNGTIKPENPCPLIYPYCYAYFQYGLDTSYGITTTAQAISSETTITATVTGLIPSTTYHFRLATDKSAYGANQTFTTEP